MPAEEKITARVPVAPKTRFEVFKRDLFTCQYCGKKAPEVVLEVDHIEPVVAGGTSDIRPCLINSVCSLRRYRSAETGSKKSLECFSYSVEAALKKAPQIIPDPDKFRSRYAAGVLRNRLSIGYQEWGSAYSSVFLDLFELWRKDGRPVEDFIRLAQGARDWASFQNHIEEACACRND